MIVLGIDPGLANIGYGIIKELKAPLLDKKGVFKCLGYGLIQTDPAFYLAERLHKLNKELNAIIKEYEPSIIAMENVYFFKNPKSVMAVKQAEGVILLTATKKGIPVYAFNPLQVKFALTGYGRSEKKEVQEKITSTLNLREIPKPDDVADALAIALAYYKIKYTDCCKKSRRLN